MTECYDSSPYNYLIVFDFDCKHIKSMGGVTAEIDISGGSQFVQDPSDISILYDSITGVIIARGDLADKWQWEEHQSHYSYVSNVFMELNAIYLKNLQPPYKHDMQDKVVIQEVITLLLNEIKRYEKISNSSNLDYLHYVFNLPTNWDDGIREKLIRPLFVQAGLISKDDPRDRLVFLTRLKATFEYFHDSKDATNIQVGQQHAVCSLDFDDSLHVDLGLVSVHYPSLTSVDSKYVIKSSNAISFTIPLKQKDLKTWIKDCLEKRCTATLTDELIDMLTFEIYVYKGPEGSPRKHNLGNRNILDSKLSVDTPFRIYFDYQPLKGLLDLHDDKYGLESDDIDCIQSITIGDIYEDLTNPVELGFITKLALFTKDISKSKLKSMIVVSTQVIYQQHNNIILLKCIEKCANTYGEHQGIFSSNNRDFVSSNFFVAARQRIQGSLGVMKKQIKESIKCADPKILPNRIKRDEQSGGAFEPEYFVSLEILSENINIILSVTGKDTSPQQSTKSIQCDIQSLNKVLVQSDIYQKLALCISPRVKNQMDDIISDCLQMNPNFDTDTNNTSWFINSGSKKLDCLLEKVQLKEIFAKRNCVLAINVETVRQASYILLFKIMYLRYLNQLIEENLNANFKNDWVNKNIAYNVSIDKNVLDHVFGSKEDLNELFYASGILRKEDQHRKALFSTYGEEIFPTIQQKLPDLKFKMKMYFVVAQIYSTHIHVALHQAVRLKSVEENGVSIVVQDRIIPIDNLYKALCKMLWTNISSDIVINYCEQHNNETNTLVYDFYLTQNHIQILKTLELSVLEIFNENTNLDMDYKKEISINHKNCTCSFTLSFRTIVEMGIKPTLQSAAKVIVASLTSAELFGSYEVDYLFLLGNPFSFSSYSQVYNAYIVLMQDAICLGIESKGKDTQFIYLRDKITDLVRSTVYDKNCLYEKFTMGTLRQVLKDTYAVRLKDHFAHKFVPFSRISKCENDTASDMVGEGSFLIVFRRGQTIPMTGLTLKINLGHLMHRYSTLVAEFIRVDTSNEKLPNDSDILPKDTQGPKFDLFGYEDKNNISFERLVLNLKYTNYNYSLQLSMRETGYKVDEYMFKDIGDPLTLAYIHSH